MSYSAKLYFKRHIASTSDLFVFIEKFKNAVTQTDMLKMLGPSLKHKLDTYSFPNNTLKQLYVTETVARTTLQLFYFPHYNLLAITWNGAGFDALDELFDGRFYFQDSTDQNYKLDDYKFFPAKLRNSIQVTDAHKEEIKEHFNLTEDDWLDAGSYYKDCYRYKLLVQKLGLNKRFLTYGVDDHDYRLINLGLFDSYDYSANHQQAVMDFIKNP